MTPLPARPGAHPSERSGDIGDIGETDNTDHPDPHHSRPPLALPVAAPPTPPDWPTPPAERTETDPLDRYRFPGDVPKTRMPGRRHARRVANRRPGHEAARTTPGCRVRRFAS